MLKNKLTLRDKKVIREVLNKRGLQSKITEKDLQREVKERWNKYKYPPSGDDVGDFTLVVHNVLNELFPGL